MTEKLIVPLSNIAKDKLYEIRLRNGFPVSLNYGGKKIFLGENGVTYYEKAAILCDIDLINEIIDNLTEKSLYAFNESIKKGFLTGKGGIRVGVAGECVYDKELITIKNIDSLNIRIPHEVNGSSDAFFDRIKKNGDFCSTLIISPPFCGKTTVLKDVAKKINDYYDKNILIIDERGEFSPVKGARIDSIKYSDKLYAFEYGIRSMSPDIIITDELSTKEDWLCAMRAVNSGVKIISTCHAETIDEVKEKDFFIGNVFDRYVILKKGKFGELFGVFDKNYKLI